MLMSVERNEFIREKSLEEDRKMGYKMYWPFTLAILRNNTCASCLVLTTQVQWILEWASWGEIGRIIPLSYRQIRSHSALNSTFNSSALLHAILQCASVCFHTEHRISAFWKVRFKKRSKIEQKDIITPMHCLAFPSTLFGVPFHIDNRTVADCGFWLELQLPKHLSR